MNNKPVAIRYDFDGYGYQYMDSGSGSDWQTRVEGEFLYTHPAKTLTPLTEDECKAIIEKHNWFAKSWAEMAMEIQDVILRKAQEK